MHIQHMLQEIEIIFNKRITLFLHKQRKRVLEDSVKLASIYSFCGNTWQSLLTTSIQWMYSSFASIHSLMV